MKNSVIKCDLIIIQYIKLCSDISTYCDLNVNYIYSQPIPN